MSILHHLVIIFEKVLFNIIVINNVLLIIMYL
jgi:hypothetical protein